MRHEGELHFEPVIPEAESTPTLEVREEEKVTVGPLTSQDLYNRVFRRDAEGVFGVDPRFADARRGGAFKYFDCEKLARYISRHQADDLLYVTAEEDGQIVGIRELERAPNEQDKFWMTLTAVDPAYQGQGVASKLAEETFRLAAERGYTLEASSYSEDGWLKLKDKYAALAKKYGVKLIDKQERL